MADRDGRVLQSKFFYVASIFAVSFGTVSLMWRFKGVGWILIVFGLAWVLLVTAFAYEVVTRAESLDSIVRSRTDALEETNRHMASLLQHLNAFHQISYEINQQIEARDIGRAFAGRLHEMLPPVDGVWLWLHRNAVAPGAASGQEGQGVHLVLAAQAGDNFGLPAALTILRKENPLVARCFEERTLSLEHDLPERAAAWNWDWLARSGMSAFAGFPLRLGDSLLGVLGVFSRRAVSAEFARQLQLSVNQLTVALEKARLLKESRLRAEELAAANEELRQLDAMKDWFVSSVSHELRTPLTSIRSFGEILESFEDLGPSERREFATVIRQESERLSQMIDDVLDLAKIAQGEATLQPGYFALPELIDRCARLFSQESEERGIALSRQIPDHVPRVYADENAVARVLNNLFSNALKFTPDGGTVGVAVESEAPVPAAERFVAVLVSDNGVGISPRDQGKVFERFTQVSSRLTDKPKGAGIGLAICREIVEKSGGQIWVQSEPGKGSVFGFTLPVEPLPGQRGREATETARA